MNPPSRNARRQRCGWRKRFRTGHGSKHNFRLSMCSMVGSDLPAAAELYRSLESERAKDAAIRSIALAALNKSERTVFDAMLKKLASLRKERNKMAHWMFALYEELPDALVGV